MGPLQTICKKTISCPRWPTQDVHIGVQMALQDMKVKEPLQASLKTQFSNSFARSDSKGFPKKAYVSLIGNWFEKAWIAFTLHSQAILAEVLNAKSMTESHEASSINNLSDSGGKVIK